MDTQPQVIDRYREAYRPHQNIQYRNSDNKQNMSYPTFCQFDDNPSYEQREQDSPDATQQRILVEQEEPEQERRHKTQAIQPPTTKQTKRQELHRWK